jgi:hypothetical protein
MLMREGRRHHAMRVVLASLSVMAATAWQADASAEDLAMGGSLRGYGGVVSADSRLSPGATLDAPTPLDGKDPRAEGVRGAGGFGVEAFVAIHDLRLGFDVAVYFSDAYHLETAPLANGFAASTHSALTYDFDVFVGRLFNVGPLRPYVDVLLGGSVLQTSIHLDHPSYGFLGQTQYNALRFMLGPRVGTYTRLGRGFYLDTAVHGSVLGYSRIMGSVGLGFIFGSDDVHNGPLILR